MLRNSVKKYRALVLPAMLIVILAGGVMLFTLGFAGGFLTGGGWVVSAGVTAEYDFETAGQDAIAEHVKSVIPGADVSFLESQQTLNPVIEIRTAIPVETDAAAFVAEMNGAYPGLLAETGTFIFRLLPSFTARDAATLAAAFLILFAAVFAAVWAASGIRPALINALGILLALLFALAAAVLLRIPLSAFFITALAVCFAVAIVMNLFALRLFRRAEGNTRSSERDDAKDRAVPAAGMACSAFFTAAAAAAVLSAMGMIFSANAEWHLFSASLLIAVLAPSLFSGFVLPGFFGGKK